MRLLNTRTGQFKEVFKPTEARYAILSHRWGEQEVTYKDMRKGTASEGSGLTKVRGCCEVASRKGYEWVWIDTCCIDKRSSAELSQAINSMWSWYAHSDVCFVHLADVHSLKTDPEKSMEEFKKSAWFTRGWTLQELLAPWRIVFFDMNWTEMGTLQEDFLKLVATITWIDEKYLTDHSRIPWAASVARRMSWVSRRITSQEEDIAYCLLGLFGINMPLLYGEGKESAFERLQSEILKRSDDESLFAWTSPEIYSGMLAIHPRCFERSGDILGFSLPYRPPYAMTNKGLQFTLPSDHVGKASRETICYLFCCRGDLNA